MIVRAKWLLLTPALVTNPEPFLGEAQGGRVPSLVQRNKVGPQLNV